jgi:hypothetical protein
LHSSEEEEEEEEEKKKKNALKEDSSKETRDIGFDWDCSDDNSGDLGDGRNVETATAKDSRRMALLPFGQFQASSLLERASVASATAAAVSAAMLLGLLPPPPPPPTTTIPKHGSRVLVL